MIRQFREKRGWTQHELADSFRKMGVPITRCIIANIETQRCSITDCQLVLFARILGVSWKSFFPDQSTLEKYMPRLIAKKPDLANKKKHPLKTSRREVPLNSLGICEMTCKSVKITFRVPP